MITKQDLEKEKLYYTYMEQLKVKTNEQLIMESLIVILLDMRANMLVNDAIYIQALVKTMEKR